MLVLRLTIIILQSIQGKTCHGCINHDIVVGLLCSELLMLLSYHSHLGFGKILSSYVGIELWSSGSLVVYSAPLKRAVARGNSTNYVIHIIYFLLLIYSKTIFMSRLLQKSIFLNSCFMSNHQAFAVYIFVCLFDSHTSGIPTQHNIRILAKISTNN